MLNLNQFQAVGRLGADPRIFYSKKGVAIVSLRVAVKSGKNTLWLTGKSFGEIAESIYKEMKSGNLILLQGELAPEEYIDKQGNRISNTIVQIKTYLKLNQSAIEIKLNPSDASQ